MTAFLMLAAGFVLATAAIGLLRILPGSQETDRLMAAQLLGTAGIAALLLFATATGAPGVLDVALALALLAAFASVGFFQAASRGTGS